MNEGVINHGDGNSIENSVTHNQQTTIIFNVKVAGPTVTLEYDASDYHVNALFTYAKDDRPADFNNRLESLLAYARQSKPEIKYGIIFRLIDLSFDLAKHKWFDRRNDLLAKLSPMLGGLNLAGWVLNRKRTCSGDSAFFHFRSAKFRKADFSRGDLSGIDFSGSVFDSCRFLNAKMHGTRLLGADLSTSFDLEKASGLESVSVNHDTRVPKKSGQLAKLVEKAKADEKSSNDRVRIRAARDSLVRYAQEKNPRAFDDFVAFALGYAQKRLGSERDWVLDTLLGSTMAFYLQEDTGYRNAITIPVGKRLGGFDLPGWVRKRNLSNRFFRRSSFKHANFSGFDLREMDFTRANLDSCNFRGALMAGAILNGANLTTALGMDYVVDIGKAITDPETKPPNGAFVVASMIAAEQSKKLERLVHAAREEEERLVRISREEEAKARIAKEAEIRRITVIDSLDREEAVREAWSKTLGIVLSPLAFTGYVIQNSKLRFEPFINASYSDSSVSLYYGMEFEDNIGHSSVGFSLGSPAGFRSVIDSTGSIRFRTDVHPIYRRSLYSFRLSVKGGDDDEAEIYFGLEYAFITIHNPPVYGSLATDFFGVRTALDLFERTANLEAKYLLGYRDLEALDRNGHVYWKLKVSLRSPIPFLFFPSYYMEYESVSLSDNSDLSIFGMGLFISLRT